MWDLNTRETRSVELNVFEHFNPVLPDSYKHAPYVLLANIGPNLQNHVLDQMARPRFVIADTMDLWINIALDELLRLLARVDMLILNDGEARMLTKETSLIKAAAKIRGMGPAYVVIKKGEHGALLFGPGAQFFSCGAYPLEDIHDPTGAGDTLPAGLRVISRRRITARSPLRRCAKAWSLAASSRATTSRNFPRTPPHADPGGHRRALCELPADEPV